MQSNRHSIDRLIIYATFFSIQILFLQVRSSGSPLSPFLYAATAGASGSGVHGDPMSSPPPAHMGTYLDKSSIGNFQTTNTLCQSIIYRSILIFTLYISSII